MAFSCLCLLHLLLDMRNVKCALVLGAAEAPSLRVEEYSAVRSDVAQLSQQKASKPACPL